MIRIVFGGAGLDGFVPTDCTDQYVNARFVPDGAPYRAPFDDADLEHVDDSMQPRPRRFTVRQWDDQRRLLTIDFVAHGDEGFAGRWAQRAQVGDRLQMSGPSGQYRPDPQADWHLMVGDESALPAIAASLDALAPTATATAIVVVDGPDSEIPIDSRAELDMRWLHRSTGADSESALVDQVRSIAWPSGSVDVFLHGEAAEVRAVRRHLVTDRDVDPDTASISPYWRRGLTDEAWREVKGRWLREQAADV